MAPHRPIQAAGAVVWRPGGAEPEVVLIHRPRWSDWSFPKGKLDPGESAPAAAVREVLEETGLRVRLGVPLPDQHYHVGDGQPRAKVVSYWAARAGADTDLGQFRPNDEVDEVGWIPLSQARQQLSYVHDVGLVEAFSQTVYDSSPLLVLRHARARNRKTWKKDDSSRPLSAEGSRQATALSPVLAAYGVRRVISSDAVRCADTVLPFVNATRAKITLETALSEQRQNAQRIRKRLTTAMESRRRIAVCSHRLVLPEIFSALGVEPIAMSAADVVVLHRESGVVVAIEHHQSPCVS